MKKYVLGALMASLVFDCAVGQTAAPAPLAPALKNLPIKQICSSPNLRYMLARSIIDAYKLSPKMIDWNDNGIIDARRLVTQAVCRSTSLTPAQEIKCFGEKPQSAFGPVGSTDNDSQAKMVLEVGSFFQQKRDANGDVKLGNEKASILFQKVRDVTELDKRRQPLLQGADGFDTAPAIFSEDPLFYEAKCTIAPEKPDNSVVSGTKTGGSAPPPSKGNLPAVSAQAIIDRFRLRGKTEDIWIGRDTEEFAGASSATFALNNDRIAERQNFDAHLVLGYAFPSIQRGDVFLEAIPYVKYDRDYIDGVKPTSANNVNNIGAGLQSRLRAPLWEDFGATFVFQPQYVDSQRTGAQVFSSRFAVEPNVFAPYIGFPAPTSIPDLWASAYVRGVMNYYDVMHDANDRSLTSGKNFWHAGVQLGGVVAFKGGTLEGLSFPIDYTYFYGISGPYRSIELLQVAANYTFPKTKYITVGLSYTSGRNLDTFEQQKLYKASLGVKY